MPLLFTIRFEENVEILSVDIKSIQRTENKISIFKDEKYRNQAILFFDFLDCNDGATIEILHTGCARTSVKLEGVIKGVPKGVKPNLNTLEKLKINSKTPKLLIFITGLVCLISSILISILIPHEPSPFAYIFILIGGAFLGMMILTLLASKKKCPKILQINTATNFSGVP